MKKFFVLIALVLTLGSLNSAQVPTRLFDVRNGNNLVDGGTTYPAATEIIFKDAASKNAVIDAFAADFGYQATINGQPNPQSKQQFFNQRLMIFIKDVYKSYKVRTAASSASSTAGTAADAELPPQ